MFYHNVTEHDTATTSSVRWPRRRQQLRRIWWIVRSQRIFKINKSNAETVKDWNYWMKCVPLGERNGEDLCCWRVGWAWTAAVDCSPPRKRLLDVVGSCGEDEESGVHSGGDTRPSLSRKATCELTDGTTPPPCFGHCGLNRLLLRLLRWRRLRLLAGWSPPSTIPTSAASLTGLFLRPILAAAAAALRLLSSSIRWSLLRLR